MKYKLKKKDEAIEFTPFELVLTFETREEYVLFHDKVMGLLTNTPHHDFHAAVYGAGRGEFDEPSGEI